MPRIDKLQGFVLKKKILLEQDYSVTLFTEELGKITAIAKGARKITSRRVSHLQTANLIKLQVSDFHDMFYIQSTELISGFLKVRTSEKQDIIYLYFYILDKMLPERQAEEVLYSYTKRLFIELSKDDANSKQILRDVLQKTLMNMGYVQEEQTLPELVAIVEQNIEEKLPSHVIM
jgi:DNA repair protein RecO (recombination protein O)